MLITTAMSVGGRCSQGAAGVGGVGEDVSSAGSTHKANITRNASVLETKALSISMKVVAQGSTVQCDEFVSFF